MAEFNLKEMEKRIVERLHPPARTGNLMERFRETLKKRKPRLPKL